ncbi:Uncharacterized protein TCM_008291 [Theobroma cacao]|uniref:Uncharacterized protein n=1 Tax=Theobroma cacao TaxID=3641 RepID=A0A061E3P9_THECC|nr:Uncharacterized protein TCM_008291 [Theobroma cacao]
MAPKRARQSFSDSFDHTRFVSTNVVARHTNSLANKIAIPKRRLDQRLITHLDLQAMIDGLPFSSHIVNEFYETPAIENDGYGQYLAKHEDWNDIIHIRYEKGAQWRFSNNAPISFNWESDETNI